MESAHQRAKDILTENRERLETVSEILIRRETIEKSEFEALLEGKEESEVFPDDLRPRRRPAPAADQPARGAAPAPASRPGRRRRGARGRAAQARAVELASEGPEVPELRASEGFAAPRTPNGIDEERVGSLRLRGRVAPLACLGRMSTPSATRPCALICPLGNMNARERLRRTCRAEPPPDPRSAPRRGALGRELVAALGSPSPASPSTCKVLREAGLVSRAAQGKRRLYALRPEPLGEVDARLEPYRAQWSNSLDALERHLERNP